MTASTILDTARDVSAAYLAAAQHARRIAQSCRRSARCWPDEHKQWAVEDMAEAHRHFLRACGYLQTARLLRRPRR